MGSPISEFWKLTRLRLIKYLSQGLEKNESPVAPAAPVTESTQAPAPSYGVPCPQCGFSIVTDIMSLLARLPVVCPKCHLKLVVDSEHSAESLEALRRYHAKIAAVAKASGKDPQTFIANASNNANGLGRKGLRK